MLRGGQGRAGKSGEGHGHERRTTGGFLPLESVRRQDEEQPSTSSTGPAETRQIKSGIQDMYQAEVVKVIAAGSLVKLSLEELEG